MSDAYGPTTRVITQDGQAPGEGSPMPHGPGTVFANDGHVRLATEVRAREEAARRHDETTKATSKVDGGTHRVVHHADGRVETRLMPVIKSDSAPAPTGSVLDGARSQSGQPQMQADVTADNAASSAYCARLRDTLARGRR